MRIRVAFFNADPCGSGSETLSQGGQGLPREDHRRGRHQDWRPSGLLDPVGQAALCNGQL